MTVMFGVGLVGLSGSMIKDAVKDAAVHLLSSMTDPDSPTPVPTDDPEVTRVLLGKWH